MTSTLKGVALAALLSGILTGCGGGGGGGGGAAAPAPTPTPTPGATLPPAPVPTGNDPVDVTTASATTFGNLAISADVGGAIVGSPPQISFALKDANGNPVVGMGHARQGVGCASSRSGNYTDDAQLANLRFAIAKLVPGTDGSPSKWVNYVVTTDPAKNKDTGDAVAAGPTRPSTESTGTLTDNGDGTYVYKFKRDITMIKDEVAAMGGDTTALGDLTYDANAVHRIAIQISGDQWGTGNQSADCSSTGVTAVPLKNAVNVIYDFVPATGQAVSSTDPSRDIVAVAKCNECHSTLGGGTTETSASSPARFHGGGRNDTRFCVVCHTDQRGYGRTEATLDTATNTFTSSTNIVDGRTIGNFPNYIHKIHLGHHLAKHGYDYAGVEFNHVTYPQPIKNCTKCHDGSDDSTAKTPNGNNWKEVPSRLACGACHDGINFATGKGVTLEDTHEGKTTSEYGHIGGIQTSDKNCALCHAAEAIPLYHVTVDREGSIGRGGYPVNTAADTPTPGWPSGQGPGIPLASQVGNLPEGVYKIDLEIKQVSVANDVATVVYRILKDGAPVTLNSTGYLMDGVDGTPSIYVAYAVPQDGNASPADWNGTVNATVLALRDGTDGTQTGPDASGYYTAVLSNDALPAGATLVTAALGVNYQGFVQLNHADFPNGIRLREPQFVMKTADGYTPRRQIVDNAKCNNCHGQLGVSPSFHSGARNNGEGCAMCHDPNRATGHVGANNHFGGGWSVSVKNLVHGIHGGSKRTQAFSYEASEENPIGFGEVTFPGIVRRCETCHVAGSYDFSGAANGAAVSNLLWNTDARGDMSNPNQVASIGQSPWITGANGALKLGEGEINYSWEQRSNNTDNPLVSSPIASSCFSCHDDNDAVQHMQSNGGTLVTLFSKVASVATRPAVGDASTMTFTKSEQCLLCHKSDSRYGLDIKSVHSN